MLLDSHGRCATCGRHPDTEDCVESIHQAMRHAYERRVDNRFNATGRLERDERGRWTSTRKGTS